MVVRVFGGLLSDYVSYLVVVRVTVAVVTIWLSWFV